MYHSGHKGLLRRLASFYAAGFVTHNEST